jgi:cytochrome P450
VLPAFSAKRIAQFEPFTRELCAELLGAVEGKAEFDAAVEYAQHIPLRVIVRMLGFPQEDAEIFRRFIRMVLEDVDLSAEERQAQADEGELEAYMDDRIAEHQADPQDDLTSFLLDAELDGNRLDPEHVRGTMILLMIAASIRHGQRSEPRCGTSPSTPRTASGCHVNPSFSTPRSRSSCARTRR